MDSANITDAGHAAATIVTPPPTITAVTDGSQFPPTPPSEPVTSSTVALNKTDSGYSDSIMQMPATRHKHIWLITGPAGCGKTSVAEHLHDTFGLPYLEGDTFHTPTNVQKMASGQPLTDADRWDWLILLRETALKTLRLHQQQQPQPHPHESQEDSDPRQPPAPSGVIVTCSALKRKYRDVVRVAAYHHAADVRVHFIFLKASEAMLMDRVRARQDHYMKDYMVHSQFESLETPTLDEADVLSVDASGTSREVRELAVKVVRGVIEEDV